MYIVPPPFYCYYFKSTSLEILEMHFFNVPSFISFKTMHLFPYVDTVQNLQSKLRIQLKLKLKKALKDFQIPHQNYCVNS